MRQPPWRQRLAQALTRPARVSVQQYVEARDAGRLDIEDRFFWQLRLESGVFKATNRHRFDDTFPVLMRHVPRGQRRLRVLDVACSSGISSVELHRALMGAGHVVETIGTDLSTRVDHVTLGDGTSLVCDRAGYVLAVEIDGMLISRSPTRAMRIFHPFRVARAHRIAAAWRNDPIRLEGPGVTRREISLVSSAVADTTGVRIVEEDMLAPSVPGRFHVIRAANVLNRAYFDERGLAACVRSLLRRLADGGFLFVLRSSGTEHHGTLWARTPNGLRAAATIGAGSEIAPIVERTAARSEGHSDVDDDRQLTRLVG